MKDFTFYGLSRKGGRLEFDDKISAFYRQPLESLQLGNAVLQIARIPKCPCYSVELGDPQIVRLCRVAEMVAGHDHERMFKIILFSFYDCSLLQVVWELLQESPYCPQLPKAFLQFSVFFSMVDYAGWFPQPLQFADQQL